MSELKNDRLLRALLREPVDVTPMWIMRQAGRYLPEYRAIRERAGDFLSLCTTPELACEVTLQPVRRFALDAAILFSDILTIPAAMGLGLYFAEGEGPRFERPLRGEDDIAALRAPDPETELRYVMDTVRLVRRELAGRIPLIGFAGSPWTLATYMVEGGSTRDFTRVKALMYREPALLQKLLVTLCEAVTNYLNAQVKAGAQALMIFDTWGGVLTMRGRRWSGSPGAAATLSASTGPSIWVRLAAASGSALRYRAIWIRPCSTPRRSVCARRWRPCWRATVTAPVTCSIWDMASPRM
jgi:uroporphyrinogen decarboxylase